MDNQVQSLLTSNPALQNELIRAQANMAKAAVIQDLMSDRAQNCMFKGPYQSDVGFNGTGNFNSLFPAPAYQNSAYNNMAQIISSIMEPITKSFTEMMSKLIETLKPGAKEQVGAEAPTDGINGSPAPLIGDSGDNSITPNDTIDPNNNITAPSNEVPVPAPGDIKQEAKTEPDKGVFGKIGDLLKDALKELTADLKLVKKLKKKADELAKVFKGVVKSAKSLIGAKASKKVAKGAAKHAKKAAKKAA